MMSSIPTATLIGSARSDHPKPDQREISNFLVVWEGAQTLHCRVCTRTDRRTFLKQAATLAGAFSVNSLFHQAHAAEFNAASRAVAHLAPEAAQDEDYWSVIQRAYSVNPDIINLNNGGVSPAPIVVQQAVERYNQLSNEGPSYYMWGILDQGREPLREKLATSPAPSPTKSPSTATPPKRSTPSSTACPRRPATRSSAPSRITRT